jgi:hypothetical protein
MIKGARYSAWVATYIHTHYTCMDHDIRTEEDLNRNVGESQPLRRFLFGRMRVRSAVAGARPLPHAGGPVRLQGQARRRLLTADHRPAPAP